MDHFKQLIGQIADGHSSSVISYFSLSEGMYNMREAMDTDEHHRASFDDLHHVSSFVRGNREEIDHDQLIRRVRHKLREVFDFNLMFSGMKEKAEEIREEVESQIETLCEMMTHAFAVVDHIEYMYYDEGGYDITRIDIKQGKRYQIFQFIRFID